MDQRRYGRTCLLALRIGVPADAYPLQKKGRRRRLRLFCTAARRGERNGSPIRTIAKFSP